MRCFGVVVVVVVADEVRREKIEGKRKPKEPFGVSIEESLFMLMLLRSSMFVKEFHLNIVPPAIWGYFLLSHFI